MKLTQFNNPRMILEIFIARIKRGSPGKKRTACVVIIKIHGVTEEHGTPNVIPLFIKYGRKQFLQVFAALFKKPF